MPVTSPDAGRRFQLRRGDGHPAHRCRSGTIVPDRMGCQPPQCDKVKRLIEGRGCAVYIPTGHAYNEYTSTYIHKGANMNLHIAKWGNRSEEHRVGKECRSRWSP